MGIFGQDGAAVEWRGGQETVRIEPWGPDSLRVRGTVGQAVRDGLPGALLPAPAGRRAAGPRSRQAWPGLSTAG